MNENKEKRNQKNKEKGNGEGTIYKSSKTGLYVGQYVTNGKRHSVYQKKNEKIGDFKDRFRNILSSINQGTYIEATQETIKNILEKHINQKFNDGITKGSSFNRDKDTLKQIEKCCNNFLDKPIQKVTLDDIQVSKEIMKQYAPSGISRMWRLLKKAFSIASSPSNRLIIFNIMNDENLKKPIGEKKTRKIKPLSKDEREKLTKILDNEEKEHEYRNIVKMEWLTGMRIGEVLARSTDDIIENKTKLHIHNTLTRDENGKTILGEHTKTYNKSTGIDNGEREFPIFPELEKIIDAQLSQKITNIYKLLFWDYQNNNFISDKEINAWLRRINIKYKICTGTLHNHRLRHDRLTQWREAGMDIKAIQYLAGHIEGSEITDDVYIDTSQEFAFEQFKKIN